MSCREGIDPADFDPGVVNDPSDPATTSELSVLDANAYKNGIGELWIDFRIVVNNINFDDVITVMWETQDDTALSTGTNPHYQGYDNQTLNIPVGFSGQTISIRIKPGNPKHTNIKRFNVLLSSPSNATIEDGTAVGVINYDQLQGGTEPPPVSGLSIADATINEEVGNATVTVVLNPANATQSVTVDYATANGTATAGDDYTAKSGTITFPPGSVAQAVVIPVKQDAAEEGSETFFVNLTNPVNAVIGDAQGKVTILANDPAPDDPASLQSYIWLADRVVADQFKICPTRASCTGYAGAAVMSALWAKQGKGKARFNGRKLYQDGGGPAGCDECTSGGGCDCGSGCRFGPILNWMKAHGVQVMDTNARGSYACAERSPNSGMYKIATFEELGGGGTSVAELVKKIKRAIYSNGAVYMGSIFYHNWNNCRSREDNAILRPHGNENSAPGHAWALTGWKADVQVPNDDIWGSLKGQKVGCFEIQSSHGCNWGTGGKGWIPYSYLRATWENGTAPRYRFWRIVWGGAV